MQSFPTEPALVTAHGFRRRAAERLYPDPAPDDPEWTRITAPSDFDLNPDAIAELAPTSAPRPAAVLVPVVARDELSVLFTERTAHLPAHAGQISFPGGKIDEGDQSALATALREAEEEIGLTPRYIEALGYLDAYRTGTGFRITPVVALVTPGFQLAINREEVADVFEVPLGFLMNAENHRLDVRVLGGRERRYYAMPFANRYIWGATAGILKNMHRRMFEP